MRDDNSKWKQEQDEHEQWWQQNERLLKGFDEIRPIIQGKKNDQARDIDGSKTPF